MIPQDPVLFQASLRDNIDPLGQASQEELWRVVRESSLEDKVRAAAIAKIGQWKDRNDAAAMASPSGSGGSSSNVRHVNDPLPTPPPNTKVSKE